MASRFARHRFFHTVPVLSILAAGFHSDSGSFTKLVRPSSDSRKRAPVPIFGNGFVVAAPVEREMAENTAVEPAPASTMNDKKNNDHDNDNHGDKDRDETLVYELMVKMSCQSCANAVTKILEPQTEHLDINLEKEIVIAKSKLPGKKIVDLLTSNGREAKLIGTSYNDPGDAISGLSIPKNSGTTQENVSCVAEFKGEMFGHGTVVGVVRIIQKNAIMSTIQASLGGLAPNSTYSLVVHQFGDPRPGHEGPLFNGSNDQAEEENTKNIGYLGSAESDDKGNLELVAEQSNLLVWEIIGRGLGVHDNKGATNRISGSILARSAVVGSNHKQVCTCDGTVIWDADGTMK